MNCPRCEATIPLNLHHDCTKQRPYPTTKADMKAELDLHRDALTKCLALLLEVLDIRVKP